MRGEEFNTALFLSDMQLSGWNRLRLSNEAGVSDATVYRFFDRKRPIQTPGVAKKLAIALGERLERYALDSGVAPRQTSRRGAVQSRKPSQKQIRRPS